MIQQKRKGIIKSISLIVTQKFALDEHSSKTLQKFC